MISKIKSILNSPHPIPGSSSPIRSVGIAVFVGCFVSIILYFLQSNIAQDFRWGRIGLVIFYGLLSAIITGIFQMVIPSIFFPNMKDEKWNLWKDILYVLGMIICIGLSNYILTLMLFTDLESSISSFLGVLSSTFFVAIFPTVFFITLSMMQNEKKYKSESKDLKQQVDVRQNQNLLTFKSMYAEENIQIDALAFLFAEAESNYVRFYFKSGNEVKSTMLRTTLKAVEEVINDDPLIMKTHRSFIINLGNASDYDGNSQGYIVFFEGTEKVARVSRSFTPRVRESIVKST